MKAYLTCYARKVHNISFDPRNHLFEPKLFCINDKWMGDSDDRLRENKPEVALLSNFNVSSLAEIFQPQNQNKTENDRIDRNKTIERF